MGELEGGGGPWGGQKWVVGLGEGRVMLRLGHGWSKVGDRPG